jgi:hypothetical protein
MVAAVLLAAAAMTMAQEKDAKTYNASHSNTATAAAAPSAMCTGKDGKSNCSDAELKSLGMAAGKRRHQPITLTSDKGGALLCDRTPCTPDQLKDVTAEAAPLGLKVAAPAANSTTQRSNIKNN